MTKQILVILVSTKYAGYMLAQAEKMARASGAGITLLRLFNSVTGKVRNRMVDPLDWYIRKLEVEANLSKMADGLRARGLMVNTVVLEGASADQVCEYAQEQDVDLMMMVKPSEALGNLAHVLIKHATMPVIMLPVGENTPRQASDETDYIRKILVPLDGSQRAEIILPVASSLARDCQAQLVLAHVIRKPEMPRPAPPNAEEAAVVERMVELTRTDANRYLENCASRLPGDVQTHLLIVDDNIAATLHRLVEQENVDLIALSAHGYSGEPQRPYGSVASNLIAYSTRPVLVVQDLPAATTRHVEPRAVVRPSRTQ